MKSQKGVTLTSLIVYVVAMLVVIAIIAMMTTYFYNNVADIGKNVDPAKEYTRFNSFFTEEVNKKHNKVIECSKSTDLKENYIIFSDGTQYTYKQAEGQEIGSVYKGHVKICEGIYQMYFEYTTEPTSGKEIINVSYQLSKTDPDRKTTKFTLVN